MFSDKDIEEAIEIYKKNNQQEGLLIKPFDKKYLTPVGYDLRVGIEGFSWNKKHVINIKKEGKIHIEPNDTVVIRSFESVNLSNKVSATVHSIVSKIITRGLSDISTTIDPGWEGKLLISVHNHRDTSTELKFKESLCTICFYTLNSPSQINRGTSNDRDDLWEQLLEISRVEQQKIEYEKIIEKNRIDKINNFRTQLSIVLILGVLVFGIVVSYINPTVGASIAAFLAVIAFIVYDRFLKPISRP